MKRWFARSIARPYLASRARSRGWLVTTLAAWLTASSAWLTGAAAQAAEVDYVRDVKPILSRHCLRCHGADEQESGLRLDHRQAVIDGGYSGPAIVPGRPDESLLVRAVTGVEDVSRMPPEGPRLPAEAIATLRAWIDAGAPAPADEAATSERSARSSHWAFQPILRPPIPHVKDHAWARNSIDAFVLERLEQAGLAPSAEADRAALIRRVSLDLLGLPPSIEEVEAFVADTSDDAYERLVDRLLDSPHYGERWGRHWLDAARYADSNGYTIDSARNIWKYRDWVIGALNSDLPFDQFTVEQLAGDMLHEPTIDQLVATGFHRNTLKNEEGGTDDEQFRVEAVVDRVSTTGTIFLGMTVGCARCHDHKYDPLSQREFYELFAIFNSSDEPSLQVPTDQQSKELPALEAEIAAVQQRLDTTRGGSGVRQREWEDRFDGRLDVAWEVLEPRQVESSAGTRFQQPGDGSLLAEGAANEPDAYTIWVDALEGAISAIRLEALLDSSLPWQGPGLAPNGNFMLSEVQVALVYGDSAEALAPELGERTLDVAMAYGDLPDRRFPVSRSIDGNAKTYWAGIAPNQRQVVEHSARQAVFVLEQPVETLHGERLKIVLSHRDALHGVGRVRLAATTTDSDVMSLPPSVRTALAVPRADRSDEQQRLVREEFYRHDPEIIPLDAQMAELMARKQQLLSAMTTTLVVRERPKPRETFIHVRGDFLRPGAKVAPDVPKVLPALSHSGDRATRLDFARWLVDGRNPLVARVIVNRMWQQYFGQGLVATENDFGRQGERPTHPELLDWLASEFMARSWSQKAVHRLIVSSAAYRQSSAHRADLAAADPYNKLLGRQARLRLEAEVIRDSALAASALLAPQVGGPSVYPPQPSGVYAFTQQKKYWEESQGSDRYRRAMYTYFWRSSPYPFLTTFDAPDGNTACTRRARSNTPLQALTLANDRGFFELARGLAARVLADETAGGDRERARRAFQLCLARQPSDAEIERLVQLVADERARFAGRDEQAATIAPTNRPTHVDLASAAAWTTVARVLLNLDEFVTRE